MSTNSLSIGRVRFNDCNPTIHPETGQSAIVTENGKQPKHEQRR